MSRRHNCKSKRPRRVPRSVATTTVEFNQQCRQQNQHDYTLALYRSQLCRFYDCVHLKLWANIACQLRSEWIYVMFLLSNIVCHISSFFVSWLPSISLQLYKWGNVYSILSVNDRITEQLLERFNWNFPQNWLLLRNKIGLLQFRSLYRLYTVSVSKTIDDYEKVLEAVYVDN